jgi:hypothetical protein
MSAGRPPPRSRRFPLRTASGRCGGGPGEAQVLSREVDVSFYGRPSDDGGRQPEGPRFDADMTAARFVKIQVMWSRRRTVNAVICEYATHTGKVGL